MSSGTGLGLGLRVGLTGGLASGKSTVARMFAELGVHTLSADEIGREMMCPGTPVFRAIVEKFGPKILRPDKTLDRTALARLAFDEHRLGELNRIVHPAVIAAQEEWTRGILAREPGAIAMVESALIFEVDRDADHNSGPGSQAGWKQRFDKIILVTVPDEQKIGRYMARVSPERWDEAVAADARRRLAAQIPDNEKVSHSDYVIENTGTLADTATLVKAIFEDLQHCIRTATTPPADQQTRGTSKRDETR